MGLQVGDVGSRTFAAPFGGMKLVLQARHLARAELDLLPSGAQRVLDASAFLPAGALPLEANALFGEPAFGLRASLRFALETLSFRRFGSTLSRRLRFGLCLRRRGHAPPFCLRLLPSDALR